MTYRAKCEGRKLPRFYSNVQIFVDGIEMLETCLNVDGKDLPHTIDMMKGTPAGEMIATEFDYVVHIGGQWVSGRFNGSDS